jgi:polyhydroxyalkanoate synthesis regulator phasin
MKKIQFLRNDTVYTPSNSGTALQTAKNAIMSLSDISDGEIVLARYQESSNEDIKTLLCIYYNGSTETGWTFIGGLRAEIEEGIEENEEITASALADLDIRLVNETTEREELEQVVEDNELVTARALTELRQQIAELELEIQSLRNQMA